MVTDLTRRGIYALPAAGLLTAAPWVFFLQQPSIKTDPEGYARSLTASGTALGGYLYLTGLICLLFGMLALYSYLARTRGSSWATGGMIISVIAIGLALPVIGILGLGNAVLADVYLAGHKDVGAALLLFEGGTLSDRIKTYIGVLIYVSLAGAIAYIVAVWKSGSLPRVAGVLVAAGFVLSMTLQPFVGWVGALCLVIGGVWVARYISQYPPRARIAADNSNVADADGRAPEASRPAGTAENALQSCAGNRTATSFPHTRKGDVRVLSLEFVAKMRKLASSH